MNPNESTRETEFVFRRLGESFPQFAADVWNSVPVWLLVPVAAVVIARVAYGRYYRRHHGAAKPDATLYWLGWASVAAVGALVAWVLVAFYNRDTEQIKAANTAVDSLGGSNSAMWYAFVGGIFALGALFTAWMYVKDSRSVRWYWAASLALLRIAVYAILCVVFLLPSRLTMERTEKRSRVVVLVDITPSMTDTTDETTAGPSGKQRKRMDLLIEFLTDEKVAFVRNILGTNPIALYPFGTRLDEAPRILTTGEPWGKDDWEAFARYDFRPLVLAGEGEDRRVLSDSGKEALRASNEWLETGAGRPEWAAALCARGKDENWAVGGLSAEDMTTLRQVLVKLERRVDVARTIASGTNVPDSLLAGLNRESPNMLQGIVVFSDGRSNLGSDSGFRELRDRASKEKIPIFTVAVGQDAPQRPGITITDVQTDDIALPDQGFKVAVEADGVNLAGQSVPVKLDVFYQGADGKRVLNEPDLTLEVDPARSPAGPYQITFAPGDPPHGSVEFVIDPKKLAEDKQPERVRALTEDSKIAAVPTKVLKEGKWAVKARIAKLPDETHTEPEHTRERGNIQVIQKKLRVLVVAGAPSREFQFIRNFLAREVQDSRAEVTLLVQNEAGTTGNLTPNPTERIILHFPNRLVLDEKPAAKEEPKAEPKPDPKDEAKKDAKADPKTPDPKDLDQDRPYNLNEYDLIIAFDMDWTEISQQQADDLKTWVERQGGGFIFVAGTVNTEQLARVPQNPEDKSPNSRLRPILEFLPVLPDDIVANSIRGTPRDERRLYLSPLPASDLLKLAVPPTPEEVEAAVAAAPPDKKDAERKKQERLMADPTLGWERFFTDRDEYKLNTDPRVERFPRRGFFSCYPVKDVKPDAKVLAEFGTWDEPNVDRRPWLVTNNPLAPWRTCFVGSGELYRMSSFDKEYYERFWGKLMKYMAAKRNTKAPRGRVLVSKEVISGTPVRVRAQILNPSSRPYPIDGRDKIDPKCYVRVPTPAGHKDVGPYEMQAVPSPGGFDGYYQAQVLADAKLFPPGETEYAVVVEVPQSGGDTLQGKFLVTRSDPELDNTRPDFPALVAMATEYDDAFRGRLPKDVQSLLADRLPKDNGVPKLAFQLADTDLLRVIPQSFSPKRVQADNRGPMNDLWDKGIDFPEYKPENKALAWVAEFYSGKKIPFSWVLVVVVALLAVEWTARKLLRLA